MYGYTVVMKDVDLQHHGILGMKWGVRRYQNPDGSLTEEGKKKYLSGDIKESDSAAKYQRKLNNADKVAAEYVGESIKYRRKAEKAYQKGQDDKVTKYTERAEKAERTLKDIDSETWHTISKAVERGFQTKISDVVRTTKDFRRAAFFNYGVIGGVPGFVLGRTINAVRYGNNYQTFITLSNGQVIPFNQTNEMVKGNKYKVIR